MMSLNVQYLPLCEKRSSEVQAFKIKSIDSSNFSRASVHSDIEAVEFVIAIAGADAEIQPPARQQIERRRLLGQQHRIVPRQHHDRRAKPQGFRPRAKPGQQVDRRRDLAEPGEMMLDHEGAVEAHGLGFDIVFDKVAIALGADRIRRCLAAPRHYRTDRTACRLPPEFRRGTINGIGRLAKSAGPA